VFGGENCDVENFNVWRRNTPRILPETLVAVERGGGRELENKGESTGECGKFFWLIRLIGFSLQCYYG
jgi:hypothetical protein